jgi:hypothetical protein
VANLVSAMSTNAMISSLDGMFIESRGLFFNEKTDMLFKVEDILNKVGIHLELSEQDKTILEENQSGRIILKLFDDINRPMNRQLVYFWTYNTITKQYHIFGQLQ